jgi:neutral ceramidase
MSGSMRAHVALATLALAACGSSGNKTPDAGVSTDNCTYQPVAPTANSGTAVTAGQLTAGAAEQVLDVPVGTALGGYTARAGFLGSAGNVDTRRVDIPGVFNASIGVQAAPRVKAVALSAGGETVVIVKCDMVFVYEGMLFDLEQRLGPQFSGKVILAASHSHSAWAQYTGHGPLKLGAGVFRQTVYNRMLDGFTATAQAAIAAMRPAKIGFFWDGNFDPDGTIHHDRRPENDSLPGGKRADDHFFMVRIDGEDNVPIAAIPIFGEHGTLQSEDNPFASTDAPGALEAVMEEQFDNQVVVMHLQSAGGDNSPTGHGGLDCNNLPGKSSDPCLPWTSDEGHGRGAVATMMTDWTAAGTTMIDNLALSMLTESVETGPFPQTFSLRDGALTYAPFDLSKTPDGVIYQPDGTTLASPIDEFDAPVGAGLCQDTEPMFPAAEIPGTEGLLPYGSCLRLDAAGDILGQLFKVDFGVDETHPVCETTRTTVSALRIGDYILGTMPGEMTVLLADYLRAHSPNPADHTILVGYAQGHVGYMLEPEDWMMGGYEPSVTFWGPLEAEYIANKVLALMPSAQLATRQDGSTASATRVAVATATDNLAVDDPAPMAGTVPATIPPDTWARTGTPAQAQPAATIPRVSGLAQFVWIGDDPITQTPHVTLEVETPAGSGTYVPAVRRSGRIVDDAEILVAYTPEPLQRMNNQPQTHVWVAEWQAVPWLGESGLDTLDDRGGVPLGKYRFHVDGHGWMLDSNPFQVVQGGLDVSALRSGGNINVTTSWFAPKGWRLMDMSLNSNQPVPLHAQAITVALLDGGGGTLSTSTPTTDASGNVSIADNASASSVAVTDRFGNTITATIH